MQIDCTACTNIVKCSRPNAMRDQTRKIAFDMRQLNWSFMWLIECARRSSFVIDQNSGSVASHAIFTSWTRHPIIYRSSVFAVRIGLKTEPTRDPVECGMLRLYFGEKHFTLMSSQMVAAVALSRWILCSVLLCRRLSLSAYELRSIDIAFE